MSFRILQKIGFTLLPIASFVGGYYFLYPQFASLPDDNHDFAAVTPVLPRVDSYKRFKNTASRVLAADQVVNLATVPLQKLDWENVVTVAGGIKYKNGDVVIHENNTLHLAPQSVHTNDIASGAVTSRTIKNHSIGGQDIDIGAAITVGTLTVSGDATFSGNQSIQGTLDINSLFHIGTNGDITKIKGLTYTWPTVHTTSGVLQNDGTGGLIWQTLGAASVTPDSLDFTEFKDTLTLDASTDIALGALTFSTSGTGSVAFNNTGLFTVAGNVGIGDTSPASLLTVGSGDLFQVNSSGAIASAAGVTSSGTITFSGVASDGAEATAILINGSNQLVYRELGSNAFTSTGYANTALSNLASVAINTSLISDTDSTDDLGSTTVAWANLYVDTIKSITGNALNITPVAGQNLNVNLSTTGDFAVNTNQLYVDTSAGNVGIGTIIPTKKLHVSGTGQTAIGVFNTDTANRAQLSAQNDGNSYGAIDAYGTAQSGNLFGSLQLNNSVLFKGSATDANAFVAFGSVSNNPVVLGTNNAERVRIDTSGNVGIGTTSPSSKLDVTTAGLGTTQTATSGLALVNTTAATAGAQQISPALRWSGFGWKTDATAASQAVDFRSYVVPVQGAANPTGYLSFGSSINGAAYNDGQMVLTSGGNVGIGTTGPAEKLEVLGTGSGIQIDATSNHIIFADGSRNVKWYEYVTSNDLRFWDTTERVTFKSGGNVGIGTTTPGYLLDVFGTARIGANTGVSTVLFGSAAPTANGTGQLNFQNSDSYPSWQIMAGGTSLGNLQFTPSTVSGGSTYTTPVMSITNSGNVGIGTTGPAGKLDVSSGEAGVTAGDLVVDTANKTVYVGRQSSTTGDNSKFVVRFRTGSAAVTLDPNSATGVIQVVPQSSVYKGLVATGTSGQTANLVDINSYGNTNGNLFVINSGGSVGIGDTTPASLLTVGSGDLFQVNSSGAIAAATGVTSSGTITLSGIASDGAEATAILINGSNQLVYRELGSNAFTSTGYANTALSNLASVAINTSLLPGTDNSIDLGSNTYRWRDLYLGSTTLHIGTSTTDEGTIAYDTTGNILNVSTDSTTNGDIAFFTDDLYLDKSTGNVGIGTTVPSKTLDVRGDANFGATSGTTYIGSNVNSNVRVRFTTNDIALTGNPYVYLGDPSNNWSLIAYPTGSSLGGAGIFIRSTADDQGALIVKARNSTQSADILSVQNSAGAVLTNVTASGLVGIGTTSPSSKLDVTTAGLGTTQTTTSGLALVNTTAAGAGAQQISPALRWSGYGWKTDATAASQAVDFRSYVVPVQGTANPTGYLSFGSSINGAAYNDGQMVLTSGGNVGIGTTVPAAKLDIQTTAGGDFNAINFHATAGQTSIITADNGPLAFNSNGPYRVLTLDASQNGTFSNNLAITKVLQVNGTGNSYIQGNVGIGTTSPTTLFEIGSSDLGDGAAGPIITLGRNTNATNTGAGSMNFMSKAGTAGYVWQDNAGQMRINTAAPTNANDTAGTVIGTQSSSLASKNLAGEFTDYTSALNIIVDAPLYNFTYKSGAYNNQEFTGIITDYSPTFGMDKDAEHPAGKSLNVVTAIGYTFGAIKQLDRSFASVNLKTDQNITTLSALQVSVDAQLTVIGGTLNQLTTNDQLQTTKNNEQDTALETLTSDYQSLTANFANLQSDINAQVSKTALIETQMATLTEQLATLTDFYTTFDLGNLITKDTLGNVDLLGGKLKAKILETGALTIEVVDPDAPTIGSAEILPVATDADSDGNDDYTNKPMTDPDVAARDGKSLVVKTKSVSEKTRVFVTLKNLLDVPLVVTKIEEGENFKVEVKTAVSEKVKFDWLIVEEK